ncbi:MAG: decaprenylphospho-beta-D-erythro-pentofuranosid-2-ulose 2-reductase [Thermoleophilaceae bacterium]|jgi:decaprenylphospho-beta-D-erythro-pentofuranosid-2-ulose 2-reductase|nr:decaprenylphospho-beta-D-erythro-pentofuranosid-2-ulose 2-reductase [Thermoleophilaceae bacterium]
MRDALGLPQSVLVLGGTSEIGVATAAALAQRRARTVALGVRDPARAEAAAARIRAAGATTVEAVAFDADDPDSHERFVDEIFDRHGDIDLVLVAFGVLGDSDRSAVDGRVAADVIRTNFLGAVSVTVPLVRRLRGQGHGAIVVLSSVAGERVRKSNFVYGSSKAGLDGFAQGLGDSLHGTGVDVMVVRPGFVKTKMTAGLEPAPLSTTADTVASAILDGLARGAHTVWVPGALRFVMAALRHLPRPLFRRLDV